MKSRFIILLTFIVLVLPLLLPIQAHAQIFQSWATNPVCNGNGGGPAVSDGVATIRGVECLFAQFINIAISLIGIAILIMLVYGAYQIIFSGGDAKSVEGGKNTITYAIMGLVVAIAGWFILNTIANFTGAKGLLIFSTQVENINPAGGAGGT